MKLDRLYAILHETTHQFRNGPEVVEKKEGNIEVTEVFMMPHESEAKDLVKVGCVLLTIGVDKQKAEKHRAELIEILKEYPEPARLAGGPSYIEVGGVIGDQGAAFQLFALGEVLGLWKVITPKTFHIIGPEAAELAGRGMVMISGFKPG